MQPNHLALFVCGAIELAFSKLPAKAQTDYAKAKYLHGKVVQVQLSQLSFPLYLIFAKQLQVLGYYEGDVDVKVAADLATLNQLREGASLTELIKQDKLSIHGDTQLLQSFSQFLQQVRFDFAEPLSRYLGDAPTHVITAKMNALQASAKQLFSHTASHLGQLAIEEYRLAPHKHEYQDSCLAIETLSQDTARLEQKIQQLREHTRL